MYNLFIKILYIITLEILKSTENNLGAPHKLSVESSTESFSFQKTTGQSRGFLKQ